MKYKPFKHQTIGTDLLVKNPIFALFDEMGLGKTKTCIDAAQMLFTKNIINKVLIISPAAVRSVWFDEDLGELAKHLWSNVSSRITEFHNQLQMWHYGPEDKNFLRWMVTNFEYVRNDIHRAVLLQICDKKTLLILDESSCVKNHKAKQSVACLKIRRKCGRIILLNGTPITQSPMDMFSQGKIMDPKILGCPTQYQFIARYAVKGGFKGKQIKSWRFLEDLQKRFKPYVIRRLKSECLDLPPKLEPVIYTIPLSQDTWNAYKEMRNEMITWLDEQTVSVAKQAITKILRLCQVTTGFIGGVHEIGDTCVQETREVGREKLDFFLKWLNEQLEIQGDLKLLVWCRFRAELQRLLSELKEYPGLTLGSITGGQKREARKEALTLLDPATVPTGPVVVVGSPQAGSLGLNLAAAHNVFYMSNDHSLKTRLQSMDRVHRPGQTYPVSYFDLMATGPKGERTVDHLILKALKTKEDLATWTTKAWVKELTDE